MEEKKELNAFKFGDDIVKLSIYYFSRLPIVENKSRCNRVCARFYGVIIILVATLTTVV